MLQEFTVERNFYIQITDPMSSYRKGGNGPERGVVGRHFATDEVATCKY